MTEIIIPESPQDGVGAAAIEAAEIPRIRSRIDTFANEGAPKQNYADRAKLRLNGGGGADNCQAFIFFQRPFPRGSLILEATLKLCLADAWAGESVITAKRITETWKEGSLTWADRPAVSAANLATVTVTDGADRDEIGIDVEAQLADVSGGDELYGFRLELDDNLNRKIYSSDHPVAALRPVLELNWVVPPLPPTDLGPGGGQVVSLSHPTPGWQFRDREQESQTGSHLQISETEDFTAPEYDSGEQDNALEQWPLGDTDYDGIPDGETRFWRVRARDEAGLWSEWSDVEEFSRHSKGELVIVNPAEAPNDFVEETTPSLDFELIGRTQRRAEVKLILLDTIEAPMKVLERWVVKTDTRVHVPPKTLKSGKVYREYVRVWDDFDRAVTPGDPPYVEASRDFTYERSGDPAPVTELTAEASTTAPKVVLTWERATQPDYFSVRVDGEEVDDRVDPDDVWVEGTTYSMDWWLSTPREEHTYEVEAVVVDPAEDWKHKHSDGNATDEATVDKTGIWVVDPDDGTAAEIKGINEPAWPIREVSERHDMRGTRRSVKITESVGGYEGSVDGLLLSQEGKEAMETLKGRIGSELRLIVKDFNLPIELDDVGIGPRPEHELRYQVSASFVQVGDWPMDLTGD